MDIKLLILLAILIAVSLCDNLIMGDPTGKHLIHHEIAKYNPIPLIKREKNVFYNDPYQRIFSSIMVIDNLHSNSSVLVTAGGVGFYFVNIQLESVRGEGLSYDIGIYA